MAMRPRPFALIILDGWGYREDQEANAIAQAKKPYWDQLWNAYAHTLIEGSGGCVGLPDGQMGNSEVGHLNMGAGRIVPQDLSRIDADIIDKRFYANPILTKAVDEAIKQDAAVHILGLVSPGGVHSHDSHLAAMIQLAAKRGAKKIYLHAFLDGRDTPPKSAKASLEKLMQLTECQIVSLIGRYYAMDRDQRLERTQIAFDLLTKGLADYTASDPLTGLVLAYERGETDEFVKPTAIHDKNQKPIKIEPRDTVIFMNFRADRARQLTRTLLNSLPTLHLVTLTEYDATFHLPTAYPPTPLENILGAYLSANHLRQLRIAETEKYAHVTFFFNGGIEMPFPLEDRILIPSPKVATYDLKPEMSAVELTEALVNAISEQTYDVIICNFANPDMVGHTGNLKATIKAIETIDTCLSKIVSALQAVGGEALITSDHGNAERMFDPTTGQPHTAHTSEKVPLLYIGRKVHVSKSNGILSDIAPTMLYLMGIPQPQQMTGQTVFQLCD